VLAPWSLPAPDPVEIAQAGLLRPIQAESRVFLQKILAAIAGRPAAGGDDRRCKMQDDATWKLSPRVVVDLPLCGAKDAGQWPHCNYGFVNLPTKF